MRVLVLTSLLAVAVAVVRVAAVVMELTKARLQLLVE
jgi:hypothetical protein